MNIRSVFISHHRKQDFLLTLLCTCLVSSLFYSSRTPPGYYSALKHLHQHHSPDLNASCFTELLLKLFSLVHPYRVASAQAETLHTLQYILVNLLQLFINQLAFTILCRISVMMVIFILQTHLQTICNSVFPHFLIATKKSTWKLLSTSLGCSCDRMSISVMGEAACLRSSMSHTFARGRSHFPYLQHSQQPQPPL